MLTRPNGRVFAFNPHFNANLSPQTLEGRINVHSMMVKNTTLHVRYHVTKFLSRANRNMAMMAIQKVRNSAITVLTTIPKWFLKYISSHPFLI